MSYYDLSNVKRIMRGLDPEEVQEVLTDLNNKLQEANAFNKELQLQINSLREQNLEWAKRLQNYEKVDNELREALLSVHRVASQVKEQAEKEATGLLDKAREEAESIVSEAKEQFEIQIGELETTIKSKHEQMETLEQRILELAIQEKELFTSVSQINQYLLLAKEIIDRKTGTEIS